MSALPPKSDIGGRRHVRYGPQVGITMVSRATLETPIATPSCEVLLKSRQRLGSLSRAMKTFDNQANARRKLLLGVESLAMCVQEGLAQHGC